MSLHAAPLCFFPGHSQNTKILQKRFLSCRAAHSLEGHPKEIAKCPNEGVSLRESQLIPQPHRMHCPQPRPVALRPLHHRGKWAHGWRDAPLLCWTCGCTGCASCLGPSAVGAGAFLGGKGGKGACSQEAVCTVGNNTAFSDAFSL